MHVDDINVHLSEESNFKRRPQKEYRVVLVVYKHQVRHWYVFYNIGLHISGKQPEAGIFGPLAICVGGPDNSE